MPALQRENKSSLNNEGNKKMAFKLKVDPSNIHYIRSLFDMVKSNGGMGVSFEGLQSCTTDFAYEVDGFDSDGDIIVKVDDKRRTMSRRALYSATVHTKEDSQPLLETIKQTIDQSVKSTLHRFHEEKSFNVGDRVRFIPELTPEDAPNAPLFVVENASADSSLPPANFDKPRSDIVVGYINNLGMFNMFPTDSRRLELDE